MSEPKAPKKDRILKSRDSEFAGKLGKPVTYKASRPSQAVNCFDGSCGRCKDCQRLVEPDPDRWFGGS